MRCQYHHSHLPKDISFSQSHRDVSCFRVQGNCHRLILLYFQIKYKLSRHMFKDFPFLISMHEQRTIYFHLLCFFVSLILYSQPMNKHIASFHSIKQHKQAGKRARWRRRSDKGFKETNMFCGCIWNTVDNMYSAQLVILSPHITNDRILLQCNKIEEAFEKLAQES